MHYFHNSETRCDRQKQIAFFKSALKSMFIKKEKLIKNKKPALKIPDNPEILVFSG